MEDLNKTQVVLLTLFITFVTSVTTGIVTVTLLQQAPPAVTQTINRVVEKTIQTVTPGKTEVKQTVVRQEDEIIQAAATLKPAIVRIIIPDGSSSVATIDATPSDAAVAVAVSNSSKNEIGTGFIVSSVGLIATSYGIIPESNASYQVYVGDKSYSASVVFQSKNNDLSILKITNNPTPNFFVPQFASGPLSLGQTAIVLGRDLERYTVSVGLISSIKDATASQAMSFKTTVKSDDSNIGGPLVNSAGSLIGLNLAGGNAISVDIIESYLAGNASTTKATVGASK